MDTPLSLAADDFVLFDLPRRYALDPDALDARWKALQATAHPDRHAGATAAAQRLAMQWAVRINEARARLGNPLARAIYLCRLHGQELGEHDNTAMPPEFLLQQMAWREALAESPGPGDVEALAVEVAAARRELLRAIEVGIDAQVPVDWPGVAALVRRLMFIERFEADIDRRLDTLQD